jgi:hypothetical protein
LPEEEKARPAVSLSHGKAFLFPYFRKSGFILIKNCGIVIDYKLPLASANGLI